MKSTTSAYAVELAEEIRQHVLALQIQRELLGSSGVVTVSVGGAVMKPDERSNASDLIEKSSRALAQAKSEGKNRAIVD
ncbi:hypothetical protein C0Q44_22605 [Paenibacillus sp. PCH8]|uniref:diguanylate cyclase domain-containing protein n=1 Tax=Paenibacillus sp. PCH8 TaxID=2066524 RepID=UPI000CF9608A|nr:diguanylate cyclase [Paenibacillus sp. PCH8]PQP81212.1 hypothetical protein C0Q44_22605 [Paenibacillus sp. PCH8]